MEIELKLPSDGVTNASFDLTASFLNSIPFCVCFLKREWPRQSDLSISQAQKSRAEAKNPPIMKAVKKVKPELFSLSSNSPPHFLDKYSNNHFATPCKLAVSLTCLQRQELLAGNQGFIGLGQEPSKH